MHIAPKGQKGKIMFDLNTLTTRKQNLPAVVFNGEDAHDIIVTATNCFGSGEYFDNTEPIMQIIGEEVTTHKLVKWTERFFSENPQYFTDKDTGVVTPYPSPRETACKHFSKALGREYVYDIKTLYAGLKGSVIRVVLKEYPNLDEEGNQKYDSNGDPSVHYRCKKYLAPAYEKKPSMPERIAETEAKRAKKGKRPYAGNVGEA